MRSIFGVELSGLARGLIALFTLVEDVTLTLWAYLFYLSFTALSAGNILLFAFWFVIAFIELYVGLEIEHTIATVTGHV
jgi:hypothetical protein